MDGLLDGLTVGFAWVVRSSWQGALLVVFILAVQGTLRGKLSAGWRHALWGLLIVRLLLVWAPPAPWSVYNVVLPGGAVVWEAGTERQAAGIVVEERGLRGPRAVVDMAGWAGIPVAQDQPGAGGEVMRPGDGASEAPVVRAPAAAAGDEAVVIGTGRGGGWPWQATAGLAWLGVAGLLGGAMLWQTLRLARQVHAGRLVTDSDALDLLEECRTRFGVGAYLTLVETDSVRSPALLGCIRPKLLVPRGFLDGLSREEMRHVFLHELAHVKRGDIWSSWAINLLTAVHWFNPLIWFARRRFIADREAACDAHVLAALDEPGQRAYGHTVLNLMQRLNAAGWAPGIAGISENNSNLKRRIVMIKHFRTPSRLAAWVGAGLCVGLGLVTLTNAQERVDLEALRQEAGALAEEGRYAEAVETLVRSRQASGDAQAALTKLIVKYKLMGERPLTAEDRDYLVGALDARQAAGSAVTLKLLRTLEAVTADERYSMANGDGDWVYFQSMETGEGPKLLLERAGGVETVPAARDSVLLSYLVDGSYSAHQQLSVDLSDKNRVLLAINVPVRADAPPLDRALLRLELRQSGKPTAAPFAMAVHRVTEPWDNSTSWRTQPKFDAEPSTVVMVPPEPGTVEIDVTDLVEAWTGGAVPNYGLLLRVNEPFYGPPNLEALSPSGMFSGSEVSEMPLEDMFQFMAVGRIGYQWNAARLALVERARLDAEAHIAIRNAAIFRLQRASWGYERRCCVLLLGMLGDTEGIPALAEALKADKEPGVRENVAIALGLFEVPEARAALEAAAETEQHPRVRDAIRDALAGANQAAWGEALPFMTDDDQVAGMKGRPGEFGAPRRD